MKWLPPPQYMVSRTDETLFGSSGLNVWLMVVRVRGENGLHERLGEPDIVRHTRGSLAHQLRSTHAEARITVVRDLRNLGHRETSA
jgi:hypothetical protein